MTKFYAVKTGRESGIYTSWNECKEQVNGFPNAVYKSFSTYKEAETFMSGKSGNESLKKIDDKEKSDIIAYIDGSYSESKKLFSYAGIVFLENGKKIKFSYADSDSTLIGFRNVAGEIKAAMYVIDLALEKKAKSIDIYYDYSGIENWAKKIWKANNFFTKSYVDYIEDVKLKIDIHFKKVKSHSGNKYNEEVDLLAKNAIENYEATAVLPIPTMSHDDIFINITAKKKSVNLNVVYENEIYDSERIFKIFKKQWKIKGNKIKDIVDFKTLLDIEEGKILIKVNTGENEEIFILNLGGTE